ncbi:flavodoxin family protein [Leifsonia poae]|uniref:Flavodoxin n=2 Tax=Leifsonia poae TaxID=110933 RepID=A0A9W6HA50_9MICO|nr:flavodoxin [Leifsonia poae]
MIVYESMFGNTRIVAEAIAEGLRETMEVVLLPVSDAPESTADVDLLIAGAPTHVHGLSRPASRMEAGQWADDPDKHLTLEPNAQGIGMREWVESCVDVAPRFAAFDTRADIAKMLSGSAGAKIDKSLRSLGSTRLQGPESFLVNKATHLEGGEAARARDWGEGLGIALLIAQRMGHTGATAG